MPDGLACGPSDPEWLMSFEIPLSNTDLRVNAIDHALAAIQSGWIGTELFNKRFEQEFATEVVEDKFNCATRASWIPILAGTRALNARVFLRFRGTSKLGSSSESRTSWRAAEECAPADGIGSGF